MKNLVIPYGVISLDHEGNIKKMTEKPEYSFLTNTGLYLIEPDIINNLNVGKFYNLPDIAKEYMDAGENVGVYPVSEKDWLDMGQFEELENMIKVIGVDK